MNELKERILNEGHVIGTDILKVDHFLNHQVDPVLMAHIGDEFAKHFKGRACNWNRHLKGRSLFESSGRSRSHGPHRR